MRISVLYSCILCGLRDITVHVPARMDPDAEDVVRWMEDVVLVAIGNDHHLRSPHCPTRRLQDLKIPITGAEWIGGPPIA